MKKTFYQSSNFWVSVLVVICAAFGVYGVDMPDMAQVGTLTEQGKITINAIKSKDLIQQISAIVALVHSLYKIFTTPSKEVTEKTKDEE